MFKSLPVLKGWHITLIKAAVHLTCGYYLASRFYLANSDNLGADPVEAILHFTGISGLNLLLLTLVLSPTARHLRQPNLMKLRRMVGLWAFCFAAVHLLSFIAFEIQFDWSLVLTEIVERPYITVGFAALVILTFLAITSFTYLRRKMGKNWQKLHNWIYPAVLLVALHFIWSVKSDYLEPLIYWAITVILLGFRKEALIRKLKKYKNSTKKLA